MLVVMFSALFLGVLLIVTDRSLVSAEENSSPESVHLPLFRLVDVTPITDGKEEYCNPVWSPDGRKIAFTKVGYRGIYVINPDGSDLREVTSDVWGYGFSWSPDSREIVYHTDKHEWPGGKLEVTDFIKVANVESRRVRTIWETKETVHFPVWLKSDRIWFLTHNTSVSHLVGRLGKRISGRVDEKVVYTTPPPDEQIWIMNADGTGRKQLTFGHDARYHGPKLSPDQTKILSLCSIKDFGGVYRIMDIDGSNFVDLDLRTSGARWSPDSRYIIYQLTRDSEFTIEASELYVIRADGTGKTQLTNTPDEIELDPHWSPDGKRIAYCSLSSGRIFVATIERVKE